MPVSLSDLSMIAIVHAAIQLTGLAFIIAVAVRGFRDMKRGREELARGHAEIVLPGGIIYRIDPKNLAIAEGRFNEILRQLPR